MHKVAALSPQASIPEGLARCVLVVPERRLTTFLILISHRFMYFDLPFVVSYFHLYTISFLVCSHDSHRSRARIFDQCEMVFRYRRGALR